MHVWAVAFQTETPVPKGLGSGELYEKTGQHQTLELRDRVAPIPLLSLLEHALPLIILHAYIPTFMPVYLFITALSSPMYSDIHMHNLIQFYTKKKKMILQKR